MRTIFWCDHILGNEHRGVWDRKIAEIRRENTSSKNILERTFVQPGIHDSLTQICGL